MAYQQVPVTALSRQCLPQQFNFKTTAQLEELTETVGQKRALDALQFGTEISSPGYNIYALGPADVCKHDIVQQFLKKNAAKRPIPSDWIYVNNFLNAGKPLAIGFPPGRAKNFQLDVEQFIDDLGTTIPSIYESERYRVRRDGLIKDFKDQQDKMLLNLQDRAKKENVYLLKVQGGLLFAQGDGSGNILDDETTSKFSDTEQKEIYARLNKFNKELVNIINQFPILERRLRTQIKALNREMISAAVETLIRELKEKYSDVKGIKEYLQSMVQDVIENARNFHRPRDEQPEPMEEIFSAKKRYEVNVIVDHSNQSGAPVIYEDNPTFMNLVGQIEHVSRMGALVTDFTLIKAGALHRANGGYLVIDAQKLLSNPFAWEGLKRALKSELVRIESLGQAYSLISTVSLEPDPIPLNCKVILIGNTEIYHLLVQFDPEFSDLFRVAADFENEMARTTENENLYVRLLASLIRKNNLLHLNASGAAKILDYSIRLVEDKERLSISIELISNLLKEAHFFAKEAQKDIISAEEVQKAIAGQIHRADRIYEKLIDETLRGDLLIDLDGKKVGQVNGLSVFSFGNIFFGRPCRITAAVRMGDGEVVDIERETKMGGPIHSKGVLILSGYLKSHFAADVPLSISASLVFEQSYGPIEGDSASMAELVALLSALAQVPIKQSIAITGSVNQRGESQPIGGINEKIEGFFDLCAKKGLSGNQGVIIPKANVKHLALRNDVIEAIKQNKFSIYSIESIDDCLQLLTGVPNRITTEKIESRLRYFFQQLSKFKGPSSKSFGPDQSIPTIAVKQN